MFVKSFNQLSRNDISIAGGKGASLGEMTRVGMSVPPGFVILAGAFDRFLEEADLSQEIAACLADINYKDINSVDKASNVIRDLVRDAKMPRDLEEEILIAYNGLDNLTHPSPLFKKEREKTHPAPPLKRKEEKLYVAVRSSATAEDSAVASWAGELESYLNTNKKNLLENIKKCWSSLFTPRAIFYRREKKLLKAKVGVAVCVQKMVQSEVSGICFTVHPVIKDKNQMIIEAGWGLGEAIVGGRITPDSYIIKKSKIKMQDDSAKFKILNKNLNEQKIMIARGAGGVKEIGVSKAGQTKQKLTDGQIVKLAEICLNIERHYGKPQDIEWAMENGKFYIVQSRPITTL